MTFSLPPTNHLAYGSSHSQIVDHSVRHVEQLRRLVGPEALEVGVAVVVHPDVGDQRLALELVRRRELALLPLQGIDRM